MTMTIYSIFFAAGFFFHHLGEGLCGTQMRDRPKWMERKLERKEMEKEARTDVKKSFAPLHWKERQGGFCRQESQRERSIGGKSKSCGISSKVKKYLVLMITCSIPSVTYCMYTDCKTLSHRDPSTSMCPNATHTHSLSRSTTARTIKQPCFFLKHHLSGEKVLCPLFVVPIQGKKDPLPDKMLYLSLLC